MIQLIRTDSENPDFRHLVVFLDQELKVRDGEEHAFYDQFNKIDKIRNVVVAYQNNEPVGCGAFKEYEKGVAEIKRMFVYTSVRGQGIAKSILTELEHWAKELGYEKCLLETGKKQPEAIALYQKSGYTLIPNYGQYAGVENSVCMQKYLL
ncbi:GNAT family N-acetyltransferase [Pontibacter vulgaris]|uniref:GNAT family N-acetyltransferase n=1 Tax=Pontibacter vulgaris TaxID=2905679 RepID=UPI001FA6E910|nr:GNAT family N-acetyltransferase [Pontibacter vulgaris]